MPHGHICVNTQCKTRREAAAAAAMAAAMTSGGGSLPAGNGNFCRRHPSLSCLGPSVRPPPAISLFKNHFLKETSSEATPRVKNSPLHALQSQSNGAASAVPFPRCPSCQPKTDGPTEDGPTNENTHVILLLLLLRATHSTRVRRQRKHFLVQVLTAAASRQRRAGGEEGEEGEEEREEAHCKSKARDIC